MSHFLTVTQCESDLSGAIAVICSYSLLKCINNSLKSTPHIANPRDDSLCEIHSRRVSNHKTYRDYRGGINVVHVDVLHDVLVI